MPRRIAAGAIPAHRAQAVAASTFSTLCCPRSVMADTGAIGSPWPSSLAMIHPSSTKTPGSTGRRRLNQSTRPGARPTNDAATGSSALSTAQSATVWLAKMRALASA